MKKNQITYYSTNLKSDPVSFREALLKGLAPDGGLYMPASIPALGKEDLEMMAGMDYQDIAFTVLENIIGSEIPEEVLRSLCKDAYDFDVPLENVYERKYILRLDQGPTASFKDFAADRKSVV